MGMKNIMLGTLAYVFITFPLAIVWHIVLFEDTYFHIGYFGKEEPSFALGFLAIIVQGVIFAYVYPLLATKNNRWKDILHFVLVMGIFHWTIQVIATAAKSAIQPVPLFIGIETLYLCIQFLAIGYVLSIIHKKRTVGS